MTFYPRDPRPDGALAADRVHASTTAGRNVPVIETGADRIDPALVGIWVALGLPQTFEVTADGGFHIAEPAAALTFQGHGAAMVWATERFIRLSGSGETPLGSWCEGKTNELWSFDSDATYRVQTDGPEGRRTYTGIWALRDAGQTLWTRELCGYLKTRDGEVSFLTVSGDRLRLGYAHCDGIWQLTDPDSGTPLRRFLNASALSGSGVAAVVHQ